MVRSPVSSRMRLTYRRDLYGVSFLPYLSRSWAAAAMRWACHSWSWWRWVVRSARRWVSQSRASGVPGRSRVASSSFVVQMSGTSCWRVRSGGAPVWLMSRSMPHACAARRMAVVSDGASGPRRMACRATRTVQQHHTPWSIPKHNAPETDVPPVRHSDQSIPRTSWHCGPAALDTPWPLLHLISTRYYNPTAAATADQQTWLSPWFHTVTPDHPAHVAWT